MTEAEKRTLKRETCDLFHETIFFQYILVRQLWYHVKNMKGREDFQKWSNWPPLPLALSCLPFNAVGDHIDNRGAENVIRRSNYALLVKWHFVGISHFFVWVHLIGVLMFLSCVQRHIGNKQLDVFFYFISIVKIDVATQSDVPRDAT